MALLPVNLQKKKTDYDNKIGEIGSKIHNITDLATTAVLCVIEKKILDNNT